VVGREYENYEGGTMSIQAPDDTAKILEELIKAADSAKKDLPIHHKLLLSGAIIDAKDLLAELTGGERIDCREEAMKTMREEIRKARQ
jgi:hypothetical protein